MVIPVGSGFDQTLDQIDKAAREKPLYIKYGTGTLYSEQNVRRLSSVYSLFYISF
jgi:hypothetical protein